MLWLHRCMGIQTEVLQAPSQIFGHRRRAMESQNYGLRLEPKIQRQVHTRLAVVRMAFVPPLRDRCPTRVVISAKARQAAWNRSILQMKAVANYPPLMCQLNHETMLKRITQVWADLMKSLEAPTPWRYHRAQKLLKLPHQLSHMRRSAADLLRRLQLIPLQLAHRNLTGLGLDRW